MRQTTWIADTYAKKLPVLYGNKNELSTFDQVEVIPQVAGTRGNIFDHREPHCEDRGPGRGP